MSVFWMWCSWVFWRGCVFEGVRWCWLSFDGWVELCVTGVTTNLSSTLLKI